MDEQKLANADTFVGLTRAKAAMFMAVFAIFISSLSGVSAVITLSRVAGQAAQGAQSTQVLCALRDSNAQSISKSNAYLAKHPNGAPALGLSRAYIQRGIEQQQRVLDIERGLRCK